VNLTHVQVLKAPREKVYAALLDPATIKACIEGCDALTPSGPGAFDATLRVGVLAFKGRVEILDRIPLESLTLKIEGKGLPGFARSSARVRLADKDGGTELVAEGEATVGGLIAAAGPRVVEEAARKLLTGFFTKFAARVDA
jgi:uncharacterized protein